jgi:protein involved in polysaccharide export with SLBB domain
MVQRPMKQASPTHALALAVVVFAAAGCGWMPKVNMPKIPMPFSGGTPAVDDPKVPFDVRRPLTHGHTLQLAVYRNFLSPSRVFDGSVVVDPKGLIHFPKAGDVRAGGRSAYDTVKAIEGAFSREYGDSTISVQLISIEDVRLVTITGAVRSPAVIQWFDNMTTDAALPYVGGRTSHGEARAVHVTRDGLRQFHAESTGVELKAGDVVNFSRDI